MRPGRPGRAQNAGVELSGKVVVVPVGWEHAGFVARRLAGEGATVVLVGAEAEAEGAGTLAAAVEGAGAGRPAVFLVDGSAGSLDALAAFLAEMFRDP
jgi:NAD(P)-dependent dehydrogenase (short-subunit alcohol dehydrogenase family)